MIKKIILLSLLFVAIFFISIKFGAITIENKEIFGLIKNSYFGENKDLLMELRLPRVVGASLVGVALAISGCVMQGITRNPLADPGILGISSGANLFMTISMIVLPNINYFGINIFCFLGASLGTIIVFILGNSKIHSKNTYKLILSGVAISTLFFSLSEALSLKFNVYKEASMWLNGGLLGINFKQISIASIFIIGATIFIYIKSTNLTVLSFDEQISISLGENLRKSKILFLTLNIFLAGSAVALAGNLTFLGLVVPHVSRKIVGNDYKKIIPIASLLGAIFLLISDLMARIILAPFEIPLTAIVSIIGLPFFLIIVKKKGI